MMQLGTLGTGTLTYAVQEGLCCGFKHMVVSSRPHDKAANWALVHSISCHCTALHSLDVHSTDVHR